MCSWWEGECEHSLRGCRGDGRCWCGQTQSATGRRSGSKLPHESESAPGASALTTGQRAAGRERGRMPVALALRPAGSPAEWGRVTGNLAGGRRGEALGGRNM